MQDGNRHSIFRRAGRKGYTLKYLTLDGRFRMRTFGTRRAAEDAALELRLRPDSGRQTSLQAYATRWLRHAEASLRPGTVNIYRWAMEKHVLPTLGAVDLAGITRTQVKDLLAGLVAKGLAKKSVSNVRQALHTCLAEAVEDSLLVSNPATRGKGRSLRLSLTRAERARRVKAFTADELRSFLEAASDLQRDGLFRLMAFTGLRLGEALALRWDDVDLVRRQLHVRRGWTRSQIQPTKSGHERAVDLPTLLVDELRSRDAASKRAALAGGEARPPWIFPSATGTPVDHNYPERWFKSTLKAAGLPAHFTPHSLRHTYASLLLQRGESIYYVQRMLGHASITMTVDLYGRWLPAGNPVAVDGLEAAVLGDDVTQNVTRGGDSDGSGRASISQKPAK